MTSNDTGSGRRFTPDFLLELFQNPLDPGYADAAARRARDGAPSARSRRTGTALLVTTLVALGFLLAVAYRQTVADEPNRTQTRDALAEQVHRLRADADAMQVRADQLRGAVAALRERELGGPAVARLRDLEAATGLARVRGDGALVTLDDGETAIDPLTGRRDDDTRVTDGDLQKAANGLWAAGAEAISINGQRLTATSTIRQAGEAILVDFGPITSPYEVVAIGPDDLAGDFRKGYAGRFLKQLATQYGIRYDVQEAEGVTLPAATEPKLRFALPSAPAPDPSGAQSVPPASGDPVPSTGSSDLPSEGGR
ncbi:MAG TPA: DUF881 domain-containing protein [Actinoplanes sp.]|nr:DUF881 domain-containing protein [Actinoplanes sp.]